MRLDRIGPACSTLLLAAIAAAQEPVLVDPEDFTRTPCEFRQDGCDEKKVPDYTHVTSEHEVLESGELSVQIESGATFSVAVSLINATTQSGATEQRVLAKYSVLQIMYLEEKTRRQVFDQIRSISEEWGAERASVAACRESDDVCFWSTFSQSGNGDWRQTS